MRTAKRVTLGALELPPAFFGFFITSQSQGFAASPGGSQGNICLGGAIGRHVRNGQDFKSMTLGRGTLDLDLAATPSPSMGLISIQAGETWNFQAWYRDANPGVTSNLTDAASVHFE